MTKREVDAALEGLQKFVTARRSHVETLDFDTSELSVATDKLEVALRNYPFNPGVILKKAASFESVKLVKAKVYLLESYELIGKRGSSFIPELIVSEKEWLSVAGKLLDEPGSTPLGMAILELCLLIAEENYRLRAYETASDTVEQIWDIIRSCLRKNVRLRAYSNLALTEEIINSHRVPKISACLSIDELEPYEAKGDTPKSDDSGRGPTTVVEAEALLSLLGRLSFVEGKISIRRALYSHADRALEQCIRTTSIWLRVAEHLSKNKRGHFSVTFDIREFALYRTAVTQCYLAFSYYRRGRFRRTLTQVLPARAALGPSTWVFSKIFADMIRAGAERRLAGIHNEAHLISAMELCERVIRFFDADLLKPSVSRYAGGSVDHEPAFLLRACYEIGTSYYYLAETREKLLTGDGCPAKDARKRIQPLLEEAWRYAQIVVNYIQKQGPPDAAFWLANAYHVQAFVTIKKDGAHSGSIVPAMNQYVRADQLIKEAVAYARQSGSKWQLTEILSDHAYILNEWAWHVESEALGKTRMKSADESRKISLARFALERLEEAWKIAAEMARDENKVDVRLNSHNSTRNPGEINSGKTEPRSNFAAPIHLYRADTYSLLGQRVSAEKELSKWSAKQAEVEYSRVIDLSKGVAEHVEAVGPSLVFTPSKDGLKAEELQERLRDWLLQQALELGGTEAETCARLGVSRATFYQWKKKKEDRESGGTKLRKGKS